MTKSLFRRVVTTLALSLIAAPLAAQTPDAPKNVVSINPFGIVFTIVNAEYERALSQNVSLGVSTTWWDLDEDDNEFDVTDSFTYTSADAKLRYYPGTVLRGFSVGAQAGMTNVEGNEFTCDVNGNCVEEDESHTAPSLGISLDYSWRLGAQEKFYIGIGTGAKRIFINQDDDDDFAVAYPFARFNVGWAF